MSEHDVTSNVLLDIIGSQSDCRHVVNHLQYDRFQFFQINTKEKTCVGVFFKISCPFIRNMVCEKEEPTKPAELNCCFYSSFIFLTNIIVFLFLGYTFYAFLFSCLWLTSVLYHSNPSTTNYILDKLSIGGVVLYGGYLFLTKLDSISTKIAMIIVLTFLATIYLYSYGYAKQRYCFDKNQERANLFHSGMHAISSIGHHLIALS
jgi:hypothetical protein